MNRKMRRYKKSVIPDTTSYIPNIDYGVLMSEALESVVKTILQRVKDNQEDGNVKSIPQKNDDSLYFRVRIDRPDVTIPLPFKEHSEKNDIKLFDFILDRWFKNLEIFQDRFEVEILFDGIIWDKIIIPYSSLVYLKNDSRHFVLNLEPHFRNMIDSYNIEHVEDK